MLHNIFSKKESKSKTKKPTIIVDHREKNSLVISELISLGLEIKFKQLPVADYIVNNTAIERKTISDFKSSIINKRIMNQLLELKQCPNYFLILEGFQEEDIYQGSLHENAFRGFLMSIILEYQVPLVYTQNSKDTAKYLSVLAKKKSNKEFSIRASKNTLTEKERLQFILEGFPQIGPVAAKKLLKHFKNLKSIANASKSELHSLIGKKAETLYDLINGSFK